MDLGKVQYFEKVETSTQKDFVHAHNNCILCGTNLELQHVRVQPIGCTFFEVKEEARCPQCDLKTRTKVHSLN